MQGIRLAGAVLSDQGVDSLLEGKLRLRKISEVADSQFRNVHIITSSNARLYKLANVELTCGGPRALTSARAPGSRRQVQRIVGEILIISIRYSLFLSNPTDDHANSPDVVFGEQPL